MRWAADSRVPNSLVPSHGTPSPRPQRSPPSATNLRPAKGRSLGHGPLPRPLRDAASSTFHSPGCGGHMSHAVGLCTATVSPRDSNSPYGCEKPHISRVKQSSREKAQGLLEVPTVCKKCPPPREVAQWFDPIGDTTGSGFEPASFSGAQGRVLAQLPGRVNAWGRRLGHLWTRGGFWWRKQGRVLGTSSPDLGSLEARESRLQGTETE